MLNWLLSYITYSSYYLLSCRQFIDFEAGFCKVLQDTRVRHSLSGLSSLGGLAGFFGKTAQTAQILLKQPLKNRLFLAVIFEWFFKQDLSGF